MEYEVDCYVGLSYVGRVLKLHPELETRCPRA